MRQTMGLTTRSGRTSAGEPLLRTRFAVPVLPADVVVRDRLTLAVSQGVQGPLTLVSAPAGSGKTVLLASWLATRAAQGTVVWMTLDDGDEQPPVFWSYVVDGLARAGVELDDAEGTGRAEPVGHRLLDRLAERVAACDPPLVLVLDDGDHLVDRALGDDLAYLLRHCDGGLRVVLSTRTDPALPLHRYRLDGALTEIRAADLAFTADETTALVRSSGLDLTGAEVAALHDRTGGWPAGLKFAAMSLSGRSDTARAIREFSGDDGDVAAYLVREVLDAQPAQLRDVLLRTSVVDQLEPGLLEALTGEAVGQRTLEFMAHGNSFIQPISGVHGHYRYQTLFREFLRAQLRYEQPELVPRLHAIAAAWLARNGRRREAVGHAVAAGSWADAATLLVDDLGLGALLSGRPGAPVTQLFAGLPDVVPGAPACLVRAARAAASGEVVRARAEVDRARAGLGAGPAGSDQACRVFIALLDARLAQQSDVAAGLTAVATAERLLRTSRPEDVDAHPELGALVAECKGSLLLLDGDLEAAEAALTEAARAADSPGCEDVLAISLGIGALVAALNGRLRHASELAYRADEVALAAGIGIGEGLEASAAARAWIRMEEYDLDAVGDYALAAELSESADPVAAAVLTLVRSRLLRARGDLEGARTTLHSVRDLPASAAPPGWLAAWLGAAEAATLVAEGRPAEAAGAIDGFDEPDRPQVAVIRQLTRIACGEVEPARSPVALGQDEASPLDTRVTAWLVQAARCADADDAVRARVALERSLRLAAPERLRRPFREALPAVRRMLRSGGDLAARYPWLNVAETAGTSAARREPRDVRHAPAGRPGPSGRPDVIVEPLTRKEQEVLGHLADLLSTDEIALAMFVSVNTVRTHVRSILRKLGAARRNEAIRRAWELELLPAPGEVTGAPHQLPHPPLAR